jgi:hypothetical protein
MLEIKYIAKNPHIFSEEIAVELLHEKNGIQ